MEKTQNMKISDEILSENFFRLALSMQPGIGASSMKLLLSHFETASGVFEAGPSEIKKVPGLNKNIAQNFGDPALMKLAEKEIKFIEKQGIRIISFDSLDYPGRLKLIDDAPVFLFYRGDADLAALRTVGVVGTRKPSTWGLAWTEKIVIDLLEANTTIMSGLALGIDGAAHKAAALIGLPTIGILAHGLDRVYPREHEALAEQILASGGGLLTEFPSGIKPGRENFPMRNRIIAAMSDVLVIVESGESGGSMITAQMAIKYKKDLMALPGRPTDKSSIGPLQLIASGSATVCRDATDITKKMGWIQRKRPVANQIALFNILSDEEHQIVNLMKTQPQMGIDLLTGRSGLSPGKLASILLELELKGVINSLPGKKYCVSGA
jgi:DNA processing protein